MSKAPLAPYPALRPRRLRQADWVRRLVRETTLQPSDLIWSFFQSVAMTVVIMLVHTYYGFTASGGPAGVGEAVGRAVRTSMVVASVEIVMISLAVYGQTGNFNLAG